MSSNVNMNYGQYLGGQHVFVHVNTQDDSLAHDLFNNFGTNLASAKRKNPNRRGPEDRELLDLNIVQSSSTVILTLHEAFFLSHALDALTLQTESQEKINSNTSWNLFRQYYHKSNNQIDFAFEYGVYHYFKTRGWIVKSGRNYGTNFLLYKEGPSIDHAQYAVIIICEDVDRKANLHNWSSLLTFHRVIQSVSKDLLLVYISSCESSKTEFTDPKCISNMLVTLRLFDAHSNTIGTSSNDKFGSSLELTIAD